MTNFCNNCGYVGSGEVHAGCDHLAVPARQVELDRETLNKSLNSRHEAELVGAITILKGLLKITYDGVRSETHEKIEQACLALENELAEWKKNRE